MISLKTVQIVLNNCTTKYHILVYHLKMLRAITDISIFMIYNYFLVIRFVIKQSLFFVFAFQFIKYVDANYI